ncbi:MAG: F0F1 ATP synthase subunit B [Pseudomonadales bacterium]|nr:F0F1 ATP synthase subunit B [Pseudomonadales bacterium]
MNINLTILGQIISFAIFVWFCMKYVWPPLVAAMEERQKQIADGLSAADRAKADLGLAHEKVAEQLREAKDQGAEILDAANKRASQIVEEAKDQARVEADRIKLAAQAEVEQEVARAKQALRTQVASIAIAGAEKILRSSIDEAANSEIVEQLAAEL